MRIELTDTELSVITDAEDITISIDNIPVELPASKRIRCALLMMKTHTCVVFSKNKAAQLANIDVSRGTIRRWTFSLKIMSLKSRKFYAEG